MGRIKTKRILNFKPLCKHFEPTCSNSSGIVKLLHEEVESIYLMDIAEMYQEEAALKMGVSRPTFTRILKNARKKVSSAIISGYEIEISDEIDYWRIAVCSDELNNLNETTPIDKNIFIFEVKDENIKLCETIENEASKENRPVNIFPKLFMNKNIHIFISSKMGEGLKYALLAKGIKPIIKKELKKEDISQIVEDI